MPYSVKEVFYTLQGEGAQSGRAAVFLRFAGCNLWSGFERDRSQGPGQCSSWCDTDFVGTNGTGGGKFASAGALAQSVVASWPSGAKHPYVVCTGGEPLLQLDAPLVKALHEAGFEVAIETNGTRLPPPGIDWVAVSPKVGTDVVLKRGNELKLAFPQDGFRPEQFEGFEFQHYFVQPIDEPGRDENLQRAIEFCLANPRWRLSLQTHKMTGLR